MVHFEFAESAPGPSFKMLGDDFVNLSRVRPNGFFFWCGVSGANFFAVIVLCFASKENREN